MRTAWRSAFRTVEGPVHLDHAAAGQDGTVLGQRGCGAETIRIEHRLAGHVQGPAVNDVPSWAMLDDRSNNTRTSGLVVHDIAGLNVCDRSLNVSGWWIVRDRLAHGIWGQGSQLNPVSLGTCRRTMNA